MRLLASNWLWFSDQCGNQSSQPTMARVEPVDDHAKARSGAMAIAPSTDLPALVRGPRANTTRASAVWSAEAISARINFSTRNRCQTHLLQQLMARFRKLKKHVQLKLEDARKETGRGGWRRHAGRKKKPTKPATTWLLATGWKRHGPLRFDDRPA
jgi:hypothetical protein